MGAWLVFFAFIIIVFYIVNGHHKRVKELKEEYDSLLRGTNKHAALEAGRAFYKALRGGKLTIYDEQAIANDISTMRSQ